MNQLNAKMSCLRLLALTIFVAGFANAVQPAASAQQFSIAAYHLLSSGQDTKELRIDTYSVDLTNNGTAAEGVVATAVSLDPNTIVKAVSVNFGAVPANTTIANAATFIVHQTVQTSFNPADMVWAFSDAASMQLSATSFTFPDNFVDSPLIKPVATVTNTGGGALTLNPAIGGDDGFTLAAGGCGPTLAPGASCSILVQFLPYGAHPRAYSGTLNLRSPTLGPDAKQSIDLHGSSITLAPGSVSQTVNPLVAQYALTLPEAGSWSVNFGTDETYGRTTSVQTGDASAPGTVYVAGMLPNTIYHMQATVTLAGGATTVEPDLTFTTGELSPQFPSRMIATTTPGMTPQPGVELIDPIEGYLLTAFATDLEGNVIWTYQFPDTQGGSMIYPVRLLPNGHFLSMIAPNSYPVMNNPNALNVIREFDLAGNTVQELTMADLNARLAANGFNVTLAYFSHDIILLPNGHYLVIANTEESLTGLQGYRGTVNVVGDTVVDLDSTLQPRWLWNSFDHLDVNRHPMSFPDWTHANSLAYSADDGNFLISLRHQNWVLKIDYRNGTGTGNVIWHLGAQGDFTLTNGIYPTDWFFAQHYANFISPNTTGVFKLELFDNGDDREWTAGTTCGLPGAPICLYSTVPQFQIDENAMTATFLFHDVLAPQYYSNFAGNNDLLPNGNVTYDLAGTAGGSEVFEVTPGASLTDTPQTVWEMVTPGISAYRATRLPSLYPGVQW
jgi:hypothetical protein